ncbi:DUF6308 family protein [Cellulomonas sp.]|uniref:DUF6308 family protein n=1 Tax=Cellulomonas sp. TaxID=40001 RepID=UPI003BAC8B67
MIEPKGDLAYLLSPVGAEEAAAHLRAYFTPLPVGKYSGAHFERLGGGGDRPSIADEFTAEDLIAVSMLAVEVVGDAALEVLELRRARLRELLRRVPTDVALVDLEPESLGPEWPVRALYRELIDIRLVGETAATKLLARKRPHLVPILDSVVTNELSIVKGNYWVPLHAWLTADGRANHHHLLALRSLAGLGEEISALRIFDVLAWLVGKGYALPRKDPAPVQ